MHRSGEGSPAAIGYSLLVPQESLPHTLAITRSGPTCCCYPEDFLTFFSPRSARIILWFLRGLALFESHTRAKNYLAFDWPPKHSWSDQDNESYDSSFPRYTNFSRRLSSDFLTMDSMRSLNTSLPSSTPRPQPPEQLLQSFKAAALSVTNLYKNAVCEQAQAKQAGYQEAIEDLLHFLDRENLGLDDGEGWKVRQWATEKCDGTSSQTGDEDERGDSNDKRDRSSTPTAARKEPPTPEPPTRQPPTSAPPSTPRPETTAATPQPQPQPQEPINTSPAVFTFTAGPTFPQYQDLDMDTLSSDNSTPPSQDGAPVSLSLMPRNSRQSHRHNNLPRANARSTTRESPATLGSKRKFTFPDFFDLSGMANGKDTFGGGKRGRFN